MSEIKRDIVSRSTIVKRACRLVTALGAGLLLLAGCATEQPKDNIKLVWPGPPQPPRIEFVRSLATSDDVTQDDGYEKHLVEFVTGEKPPEVRLGSPMGIAVSDDGKRVYVTDFDQLAVFEFDLGNKKFIRVGGKDKQFERPSGIALDGDENIYVVETDKKGIQVMNKSGAEIRFITDPSISRPTGIAIDRKRQRIYLADTAHSSDKEHTVKIFDMQGKLLGAIGKGKGSAPGEFLFPTYVALDQAGNVYVTDTLNSRIQKFDPDGKYLDHFGERGTGWGMFDKPKGIALDAFDNLYAVDSGWSNVQIFNQKKQILLFFGGRGTIPGLMLNPTAISIDKNNRIYVADNLNHRVEVYQLVNTTAADSYSAPQDSKPAGKDTGG
jgi:DNA-binding beta-propeller fold protein YncE